MCRQMSVNGTDWMLTSQRHYTQYVGVSVQVAYYDLVYYYDNLLKYSSSLHAPVETICRVECCFKVLMSLTGFFPFFFCIELFLLS